jgi:hypothetical protein
MSTTILRAAVRNFTQGLTQALQCAIIEAVITILGGCMKVKVVRATVDNWYKVGEEYEVESKTRHRNGRDYYPLVDDANIGIGPEHCEIIEEKSKCEPKLPFKVRCVDNDVSPFVFGATYEVTGVYEDKDYLIYGWTGTWRKDRFEIVPDPEEEAVVERNKYMREVKPGVWVDVYDLLKAFDVSDPCLQHLIKKALAAGKRGHKDALTDYKDILDSAKRALELYKEWNVE